VHILKSVEVFDVYGRSVGAYPCGRPKTTINIAHLQAGLYFVKVSTDAGVITRKIIKH